MRSLRRECSRQQSAGSRTTEGTSSEVIDHVLSGRRAYEAEEVQFLSSILGDREYCPSRPSGRGDS